MNRSNRIEFVEVLAVVFDNYRQPLPSANTLNVWCSMLEPYTVAEVGEACERHMRQDDKFPPTIGSLLKLLAEPGTPIVGVEEAWAIALKSRDETETVVWTTEMAEAFDRCRPVLDAGDEVGARMAFKDTYNRLVDEARRAGRPT